MTISELFLLFHIFIFFGFLVSAFFLYRKLRLVSQYKAVKYYFVLLGILTLYFIVTILMIYTSNEIFNSILFGSYFFLFSIFLLYGYKFTRLFSSGFIEDKVFDQWSFTIIYFLIAILISFYFLDVFIDINMQVPIYKNFQHIQIQYHPVALIGALFPLLLLIGSSAMIVVQFLEAGRNFRKFALLILVPYHFYAFITFMVFMRFVPELFMAPFFSAVTVLILGYALFVREKIYTIAPISRVDMIEYSDNGLIALDRFGYIVDINYHARFVLNYFEKGSYRHIAEVFDQWSRVATLLEQGQKNVKIFFTIELDGKEHYIQVKVSNKGKKGMVCLLTDVSEFKELIDHLQYLAYHDKLTGLANRAMFEQGFEIIRKNAVQENKKIGLMMIDMRGLKMINDKYGHDKGDAVIRVFGSYLEDVFPDDAILARLGGDEFVAAFYDLGNEELRAIGEKLIEAINRDSSGDDNKIFIDCAIGISCCVNVNNVKLRSVLMKRADLALFAAKKSGEPNIVVWDENSIFI